MLRCELSAIKQHSYNNTPTIGLSFESKLLYFGEANCFILMKRNASNK